MNFTFFEYFLVILSSSFIIFSLGIRSESSRKYREFLDILHSLREYVEETIKDKDISNDKRKRLKDNVDAKAELFNLCLKKVNSYIYHSFYCIFFFSAVGLVLTSFYDINIFNLISDFSKFGLLLTLIEIIAIILIYWYLRAIFVLILYTKIDYDYLEKLAKRFDELIDYETLMHIDDESEKGWSQFKVISLKYLLFPVFLVFNKEFKLFFYKYYNL